MKNYQVFSENSQTSRQNNQWSQKTAFLQGDILLSPIKNKNNKVVVWIVETHLNNACKFTNHTLYVKLCVNLDNSNTLSAYETNINNKK